MRVLRLPSFTAPQSLNPLLSEAVFSMRIRPRGVRIKAGRLNPLLSEAVFSMAAMAAY